MDGRLADKGGNVIGRLVRGVNDPIHTIDRSSIQQRLCCLVSLVIDSVGLNGNFSGSYSRQMLRRADGVVLGQLHVSWAIMVRMTMLRHET